MSRTIALGLALAMSCVARADDTRVVVRAVTAAGKPASGTKAWVFLSDGTEDGRKEPTPFVADADGKLLVTAPPNVNGNWGLFARDEADRLGSAWFQAPESDLEDAPVLEVVLVDTTKRTGRVMTVEGKPVPGAVVMPQYYAKERKGQPSNDRLPEFIKEKKDQTSNDRQPEFIGLPEWERTRLTVKTDADGRFKLTAPAAGYSVTYHVKAEGFGESKWVASSGVHLDTALPTPGAVVIDLVGVGPAVTKDLSWDLWVEDRSEPSPGVHRIPGEAGTFDGNAKLTIPNVMPGKYLFTAYGAGQFPCLLEKTSNVEVTSGKTTPITAKFGPAATVTGQVIDKDGKGIAVAEVLLNHTHEAEKPRWSNIHVRTDATGKYTYHGSAGLYALEYLPPPDGYALPTSTRETIESAKVELGKTHTFAPIVLLKAVTFAGQVVLADGKPAANAKVTEWGLQFERRGQWMMKADNAGKFAIKNMAPDGAVAPRIRLGKAVNILKTYDLKEVMGPVTIALSEANATAFKGRVLNATGQPIPATKVVLYERISGVGRSADTGAQRIAGITKTDAEGRYEFPGMWAGDHYSVNVQATGYANVEGRQVLGEVGKTQDFGDLKLTRTSLSVRGTVVGADGKPIGGAEVFSVDAPIRASTSSAADGSFTLNGLVEGRGFVFARKAGHRLAVAPIAIGDEEPVSIALARADGLPVPPPQTSPAERAARDGLNRRVITFMWETNTTFGSGGTAVELMAQIDLATARRWRDEEKKRTDGNIDFTPYLERGLRKKTLFTTAKNDPDEAIATIKQLGRGAGFYEAVGTCERMLAVDKARALLFAEEALVKARQQDLPDRVSSLAQAGDLAVRAGNVEGGKKVVGEAVEQAIKLGPGPFKRDRFLAGGAAKHIAPYNWDRAEWLLNTIEDPMEFNRFLAGTAANLARTNLPKAKQLLTQFKPDHSLYAHDARLLMAFAIAANQPDEAIKLIDDEPVSPYRFTGYIRLAALFTPKDRARGMKMIDTAFDFLESHSNFDSRDKDSERAIRWGAVGERWELAAVGAVRAKEIGYPDVPQLIARCVALRPPTADRRDIASHERDVVNLAALLALVDPATARQLLETIGTHDDLMQRAMTQGYTWLVVLALTYPEKTNQLADKLMQRAKAAPIIRDALSETGFYALTAILTAEDPLRELASYAEVEEK